MGHTPIRERLSRSETGEIERARTHLARLVGASQALVAACGHHPDRGTCADAACLLAEVEWGPARCHLAHRLAMLDVVDVPVPRLPTVNGTVAHATHRFDRALLDSLDAVRACRQVAHTGGACWFASPGGPDGCLEVLRLAHRTG